MIGAVPPSFLSCLRGSEHKLGQSWQPVRFLSCLRGSERVVKSGWCNQGFLSCLRGSELARFNHNRLIYLT